jgi:hypothetical protein
MAALLDVVELAQHAAVEFLDHSRELVLLADVRVLVDEGTDFRQRVQVAHHLLPDTGSLDFHGNAPSAAKLGAMHLAQRGGRQRRRLELGERLGDPDAELLHHDSLDLRERKRLDLVLEPRERGEIGRWQEVRARGQELAQLDEGWPQLLEVVGQALRLRRHLGGLGAVVAEHRVEPGDAHEVRAAVLDQQPGDVLVALQVLRLRQHQRRERLYQS